MVSSRTQTRMDLGRNESALHCCCCNQSATYVCLSVYPCLPPSLPSFHCSKTKTKRDQTLLGLLKTIYRKHTLLPKILQMQLHPITIRITIAGRIKHKKHHKPTQGAILKTRNFLSPIQTHKQSTIVERTLFFAPPFFFFFFWGGGNLPMDSMLLNFKTQILETLRNLLFL
jgi:hypothetical protein